MDNNIDLNGTSRSPNDSSIFIDLNADGSSNLMRQRIVRDFTAIDRK